MQRPPAGKPSRSLDERYLPQLPYALTVDRLGSQLRLLVEREHDPQRTLVAHRNVGAVDVSVAQLNELLNDNLLYMVF